MEAPDKIYVKEFDEGISQMWSSIKATETTANVQHEYIRSDLAVERKTLIGYINNRIRLLDKLLEANDSPVVFGKLSAFQQIKDHIEKIESL